MRSPCSNRASDSCSFAPAADARHSPPGPCRTWAWGRCATSGAGTGHGRRLAGRPSASRRGLRRSARSRNRRLDEGDTSRDEGPRRPSRRSRDRLIRQRAVIMAISENNTAKIPNQAGPGLTRSRPISHSSQAIARHLGRPSGEPRLMRAAATDGQPACSPHFTSLSGTPRLPIDHHDYPTAPDVAALGAICSDNRNLGARTCHLGTCMQVVHQLKPGCGSRRH